LLDIMGHLDAAISLMRVAQRSLSEQEIAGDEECVLRQGIAALTEIHMEIDRADQMLCRHGEGAS
jgi:hypothetical protein